MRRSCIILLLGRAIRHKNDYATIILLDQRYTTPRISNKLPKWIGDRVERYDKFGKAMGGITRFFRQFPSPPPPSITQAKT